MKNELTYLPDTELNLTNICSQQNEDKYGIREITKLAENCALESYNETIKNRQYTIVAISGIIVDLLFYAPQLKYIVLIFLIALLVYSRVKELLNVLKATYILDKFDESLDLLNNRIDAIDDLKDYINNKEVNKDQLIKIITYLHPLYKEQLNKIIEELAIIHGFNIGIEDKDGNLLYMTDTFDNESDKQRIKK